MAASGFTPISLYYSTTASAVPTSGNLANGELGLNIADMKLYAKNSAGVVTLLASSGGAAGTVSSVSGTGTVNGLTLTGTVTTSGSLTLGGTLSLVSPPPIGSTSPNTGAFTSLSATTTGTFGDHLVFNNPSSSSIGAAGQRWLGSNGSTTGVFLNALTGGNVQLGINNTGVVSVSSTGLAVTGAMSSTTATVDINSASQSSGITLQNSNTGGYGTQFNSALYGYAGSPAAMFNVLSMQTFYDGSTGYVTFYTKAQPQSTQAIALSLAGNGSVGIGTSSPAYKLDVTGTTGSITTTRVINAATGASDGAQLLLGNSANYTNAYFRLNGGGNSSQAGAGSLNIGVTEAAPIAFYTANLERFRFGPSGQFGIGGATYGTSGQVLTSGGSGAAPTWANAATGTVTSITVAAGTGMSGGGTVTTSGTVTLTNAGVTSVTAGTGISVSASTGGVTITSTVAGGSQAFVAFGSTGGL